MLPLRWILVPAVCLTSWSWSSTTFAQPEPALTAVRVTAGLDKPVYVTVAPGDHHRLFVLEQDTGRIRVVKDGVLLPVPFLDIGALIEPFGERGLLGLAFHPDYERNGRFFVFYTRKGDGWTVIERYRVSPDPDLADASTAATVLVQGQPFANHNGGTLQFGADGYLYCAFGDGGGGGDLACAAQNLIVLLGKMIRIDVDGAAPYAIPPGNPFVGVPGARGEIWSLGWRNPFRFSFDGATGDVYVGDVGQGLREEISFEPAATPGQNYGWKVMEGELCFGTDACPATIAPCNSPVYVDPAHTYSHALGCAVIGGYVYRGCGIPGLDGTYFFADHCSGRIWSFRQQGGVATALKERTAELKPKDGTTIDRPAGFGEDLFGELYIVDHDGELFRITADAPAPASDVGFGKAGGNGLVPLLGACGLLDSGHSATVFVHDAAPNRAAWLAASSSADPIPLLQGTLVPKLPPLISGVVLTDALGSITIPVAGGLGSFGLFAQCLVDDPGASAQVAFSNAILLQWQL